MKDYNIAPTSLTQDATNGSVETTETSLAVLNSSNALNSDSAVAKVTSAEQTFAEIPNSATAAAVVGYDAPDASTKPKKKPQQAKKQQVLSFSPSSCGVVITAAPTSGLACSSFISAYEVNSFTQFQEHTPRLTSAATSGLVDSPESALLPQVQEVGTRKIRHKRFKVANIRPPCTFREDVLTEGLDSLGSYPLTRKPDTEAKHLESTIWQINLYLDAKRYIIPKPERRCPYCGAYGTLDSNGSSRLKLRHAPWRDHPVKIEMRLPVWKCQHCGKKHVEAAPERFENTFMTKQKRDCIIDKLHSGIKCSIRDLAIIYHESEKMVARLMDLDAEQSGVVQKSLPWTISKYGSWGKLPACNLMPPDHLITAFEVDEVAMVGRNYLTQIIEYPSGHLIFYAFGHGSDAIRQFFSLCGNMIAQDVRVSADMNAAFLNTVLEFRPNAVPVYDRFHFERNFREHYQSMFSLIATDLDRSDCAEKAQLIKDEGNQFLILCVKPESLSPDEQQLQKELLALHPMLQVLNQGNLAQHLGFECRDRAKADVYFEEAIRCCDTLQRWAVAKHKRRFKLVPELADHSIPPKPKEPPKPGDIATAPAQEIVTQNEKKQLRYCEAGTAGHTLLKHKDKFLNYADTGITTGQLEGTNNVFKAMKRVCYGIKLVRRFMYRLWLISRAPYRRWV